jgi:hypothetical protein
MACGAPSNPFIKRGKVVKGFGGGDPPPSLIETSVRFSQIASRKATEGSCAGGSVVQETITKEKQSAPMIHFIMEVVYYAFLVKGDSLFDFRNSIVPYGLPSGGA